MNEQLELFGSEFNAYPKPDRPRIARRRRQLPRYNLFLGFQPGLQTIQQLVRVRNSFVRCHRVSGTCRPVNKLHVSLLGFSFESDVSEKAIVALQSAAEAVAAHTLPFRITFDRFCSFGRGEGSRPLVMTQGKDGNPELVSLYQDLLEKLTGGLIEVEDENYRPHMTVLYGRHAIHDQPVKPVAWTAREIVLILSERGAEEYQLLNRWPLAQP